MNTHTQRALVLIEQGRWDLARKELEQSLAQDPEDAFAHAMLSTALIQAEDPTREDLQRATEEAEEAVRCDPEFPYAHVSLARVMLERNRFPEAQAAAAEAIRLDPEDAGGYALAAAVEFRQSRWKEALALSERALQLNPEHGNANNLRAMSLVKLGRRAEAGATIDAALQRNPEDADSHANKGWTLLEQGQPDAAMNHFKEALRLEPDNAWARRGIVEAIKARSFIYAAMLKYFLWMSRFSGQTQFAIMISAYFLSRVVANIGRSNPQYALYCQIFLYAYFAFAIMTWIAVPLFNLVLRTHPLGKYALSDEEKRCSNWIGAVLGGAVLLALYTFVEPQRETWRIALNTLLLVVPVVATYAAPPGIYRALVALWAVALLGVVGFMGYIEQTVTTKTQVQQWVGTYRTLSNVLFYGILGTSIATGYLRGIPRRK